MTETKGKCPWHTVSSDGTDSYYFNEKKGVGRCFSCDLRTWVDDSGNLWGRHGAKGKPKMLSGDAKEDHTEAFDDFYDEEYQVTEKATQGGSYKACRGISKETMEHFGVLTVEHNGHEEHLYKYPSGGIKHRNLSEKSFYATDGFKGDELFGQNLFPAGCSKTVTITEGEVDTLSAWQMLTNNGQSKYVTPVVSLPGATPSGKLWEKTKKWLDSFDKIIVSADNDEPGKKVVETLFDLFPGKIYLMEHGQHKDANDFLMFSDQKAYKDAWWGAKRYSPAGFTASVDDWLKALSEEDPYQYTATPFEAFNKVGRGIVKGGITVLKAPPGSGKSSLLRCLQHDLVKSKGQKVAVLMMEEVKSITGRAMATYELGKNVMTREDAENNGISEEQVKESLQEFVSSESFVSFDVNPQDPIEDTLRQCNQAIAFYGVDYIFIDHLQRLAYLSGTDGATASLTELGVKLTELAKRKNVGIICISHVNADGSTKYAKSIEEEAIVLIELSRDKEAEDYEERNTSYLNITKNRPFGLTGSAGALIYNPETTILTERLGPQEPKVTREDF